MCPALVDWRVKDERWGLCLKGRALLSKGDRRYKLIQAVMELSTSAMGIRVICDGSEDG